MSAPVFISPDAATATPGARLLLTGDEARHAVAAQRRTVGEVIDVVDGAGARARGPIVSIGPDGVEVLVDAVSRDADRPITLVQALAKGGRDEDAIEAATELGVTRIVPWSSERAIVQWRGDKRERGRDRWSAVVTAAAKVARRAVVPAVDPLVETPGLAVLVRQAISLGDRVVVLHEEAGLGFSSLEWPKETRPGGAATWLIVGPEGGIGEAELATLTAAGAVAARLGPHVLRASTAGPAAIAALAALSGDWEAPAGAGAPVR